MNIIKGRTIAAACAVLVAASCGVNPVSVPNPTGPSELSLSLALVAKPDVISQDGVSIAWVIITARDAKGQPVNGVDLRVETMVEGVAGGLVVADFGTLSNKWPTTGSDGTTEVTYRAPAPPAPGVTSDRIVTFRVAPIGTNYANTLPRTASLLLVRPGVITPPTRMVPRFTFSPTSPREFDAVNFDATSSSDPDGQIVAYSWQFGDGHSGAGRRTTHEYELAGAYSVVLTVLDANGNSVSTAPETITVSSSPSPVAKFTASPTAPSIGTPVVFNAAASTAPAGRRIVGYNWDLGDGTFVEGVAQQHVFQTAGTFTVVLTVTDNTGRTGVTSSTISVSELSAPIANFTVSPTNPGVGATVVFNAAGSTVPTGRQIVAYDWDFGDATSAGSGVAPTHVYAGAGTFTVVLTVTDSAGRKGVASTTVTVGPPPHPEPDPRQDLPK